MLPLVPFSPSLPLEPLLPETSIMKLWLYRMGISRSVRRPGWLGTVTVTCATFPSLTLGSPGRDAIPLLIDGPDTGRYFEVLPHHLSLAFPFRHQCLTVRRHQFGNFCPGAIPWPLLRLACMDEMGVFAK